MDTAALFCCTPAATLHFTRILTHAAQTAKFAIKFAGTIDLVLFISCRLLFCFARMATTQRFFKEYSCSTTPADQTHSLMTLFANLTEIKVAVLAAVAADPTTGTGVCTRRKRNVKW